MGNPPIDTACLAGLVKESVTLAACLAPSSRNTPRFMATRDADRGARETREDVRLREDERAAKQGNWKGVFL